MKKSLFLVSLALFLWSNKIASPEDVESAGAQGFDNWMQANDDERVKICREESKKEFASLEEATGAVNFTVKYPENLKDKKLLGIFIANSNRLILLFTGGLYITQRISVIVPDYSSFVANQTLRLITVNNCTGMGCEPDLKDFGTYTQYRPGFIEWHEDGVVYSVFGDEIPLDEVIEIGVSMKNLIEKDDSNT